MSRAIVILTQNKFSLVDDEDFDWINEWKWSFDGRYAVRTEKGKRVYLHRLLMKNPVGMDIDHINGDKLDNRKENLRIANSQQNSANMIKHGKYKYKGIYLSDGKRNKKWAAQIIIKRKNIHLGRFFTQKEAGRAYNIAAKKYFGDFARLNKI